MTGISPLAMTAKKVIDAQWFNGPAYDLATQAAEALESAQLLMSPELAAEMERLRNRVAELEQHVQALTAQNETLRAKRSHATDGITRRIAPVQVLREDGEHYAVVHHDYRIPHDLPPIGGA